MEGGMESSGLRGAQVAALGGQAASWWKLK